MATRRIAIIGCGKQASKHVQALQRTETGFEPLFVDVDPGAAERLAGQFDGTHADSLEAALADPAVTAVDVCTPTPSHYPIIKQALQADKHIFCEKPLCETAEQTRDLIRLRQERGMVGMVGYLYRFCAPFQTLWQVCGGIPGRDGAPDAGALGEPVLGIFRIGGRGSHQVWKHLRAQGGGVRQEMLVHMLDLANWSLGAPERVDRLAERLLRPERTINGVEVKVDAEDYTVVRLVTRSGTEILIEADLLTPSFSQHVEVQGTNGSFFGSIQPNKPQYLELQSARGGFPAGRTELAPQGDDPFARQMRAFADAIDGGAPVGFAGFEDSLRTSLALEQLGAPAES